VSRRIPKPRPADHDRLCSRNGICPMTRRRCPAEGNRGTVADAIRGAVRREKDQGVQYQSVGAR
jgi:hypothetical protein